jgi:hypothetical protein
MICFVATDFNPLKAQRQSIENQKSQNLTFSLSFRGTRNLRKETNIKKSANLCRATCGDSSFLGMTIEMKKSQIPIKTDLEFGI